MNTMSEDLAREMQATKDDPSEWGDPVPAPKSAPKRKLAAMVSVRLSPSELAQLQAHVEALGESVSGYMRRMALESLQAPTLWQSVLLQGQRTSVVAFEKYTFEGGSIGTTDKYAITA